MFKTKRDVDRHVTHILNKIRDEKERHSRGFQFAKLYFDVADYESSKRYLQAYLSVRETVPQAHKLLGQVYEALKDKAKAIESYKRSLDLDPEQKDLVLKICECYSDPGISINADNAKFWIEKAEKLCPDNHTVFKLKERVIDKDSNGDSSELEHLICSELLRSPSDVNLHIKLLKLFMKSREVDRAYEHATKTEKTLAFVSSVAWYECVTEVYQVYKDQHSTVQDHGFYIFKLYALSNLAYLKLKADDRDLAGAMEVINQFDQDLFDANNMRRQSSEWESYLMEMKGQLFYLLAILLLKKALKGQVTWKDASSFSAVCFLLSDSFLAVDLKKSTCPQDMRKFYDRLYLAGCDRLSQGGHVVYSLLNKQGDNGWTRKLRQKLCIPQGRDTLYSLVFRNGELGGGRDTSYVMQSDVFTSTALDVPSKAQLAKYDSMAYTLYCDNLKHLVWLAMQYHSLKDDIQPDYEHMFGAQLFPELKYSVCDLSGGDPGTLCQLDVQVFFCVCVRWACIHQRETRRNLHTIPDKPDLLPVCLETSGCSPQQSDWWSAVYKMEHKVPSEKLAKLWGVVIRGLETVRLVQPHTMPLSLVAHVAHTLDKRAKDIEELDAEGIVTPKLKAMRSRAAFYWSAAEDMLQNGHQGAKQPKEMLFPLDASTDKELSRGLSDPVKFAMAAVAMREERFEEALRGFDSLYTPAAAYHTGVIYRNLAESADENANSSGSGQNSQRMAYLSKAKYSLCQTLDRLEQDKDEELKELAQRDLSEVYRQISEGALGESMVAQQPSYDLDETDDSEQEEPIKHLSPRTPTLHTPSKRRDFLTISPTRIDIQLKAVETTNAAMASRLSTIEETIRTQEKLIQELFSQLRESRDEYKSLRELLQSQQESAQNVGNLSMAGRPNLPPPFPGTPHQRNLINPGNATFSAAPYDYYIPTGIPPHMAQYGGYSASSPRPGSAYGQPTHEEDFNHVDGEFYSPDLDDEYCNQDQNLIQEWPFGQKAGVEGKSTITYSPQHQARNINPANAGIYANVLRGQSIQYGGFPPQVPQQQTQPLLPGPGFFSQNNQQMMQPAMQTQAERFPGQAQMMQMMPGVSPSLSPAMQPPRPGIVSQAAGTKPVQIMPPNAVASHMAENKPTLNPGSVGVPTPPKKDEPSIGISVSQPASGSASSVFPASMAGTKASLLPAGPGLLSTSGPAKPGAASSMLSQLAAKHQETVSSTQTSTASSVPASTPQKTIFQGFSFTSTPKITQLKPEEKPKEPAKAPTTTTAAAKPFSGFSFTTPTQSPMAAKSPLAGTGHPSSQPSATPAPFSFGQSGATASFGSLAAGGQTASGFGAGGGDFKGFSGTGQQVFSKSPSPRRRNTSAGSDDHVDEYEPNVDFKPVVPLPDLVEVKTGEEDEEKVFGERAKLFRFDSDTQQWKERGIGEMKILKHKVTKVCRILMRREQVLKLCANHILTKNLKLTPMMSSDKAWVWTAADFSEGETKHEKLAVKFKSQDLADGFKKAIEKCQAEMNDNTSPNEKIDVKKEEKKDDIKEDKNKKEAKQKKETAAAEKTGDLASLFKPKAGSWTCSGCYVRSNEDVLQCPCCKSLKPGVKKEDIPAPASTIGGSATASGFKFGTQTAATEKTGDLASQFKPKAGSWTCSGCYVRSNEDVLQCPCCKSLKPGVKKEDIPAPASTIEGSATASGFKFGTQPAATEKTGDLASLFKPKAGSWTCSGCYVRSNEDVLQCPCCKSLKPGVKKEDLPTPASTIGGSATASGFKFGTQATVETNIGGGFKFASSSTETPASGSTGGFRFGAQTASSESSGLPAGSSAAPCSQAGGFRFDSQSTSSPSGLTSASSTSLAPSISTASSTLAGFRFGGSPAITGSPKAPDQQATETGLNLPEPCKPSSGFTFGSASKENESIASAGFNVSKDTTKYTFGDTPKPDVDNVKEEKPKVDVGESLLAQYLTSPDSGLDGVSSTSNAAKDSKVEKPSLFGLDQSAASMFGQSSGASFQFGSGSTQTISVGSASADAMQKGGSRTVIPKTPEKKPESLFGKPVQPAEGFKFSMTPSTATGKPQPAATLGGGFNFSLNMTTGMPSKTSPQKSVTSPKSPEVNEEGYYVNKEGDDSHIHFEPVVSLPEKVDLKTGEEDEEVLFTHRAKLFRFTKGEWKERGLGDMKVLFNANTLKARILMRREQILKLCCNHYITQDLQFKSMPDTHGNVLSWFAMDFADGEPKTESFSVKFKTADIAERFKKAVDDAKVKQSGGSAAPFVETVGAATVAQEFSQSDDVIFVKVEKATSEQVDKARALLLPDNFYLYEQKPPCPGCIGCEEDIGGIGAASKTQSEVTNPGYDEEDEEDDYEDDDDDYEDDEEDDEDEEEDEDDEESGRDAEAPARHSGKQLLAQLLSTDDADKPARQGGLFSGSFMPSTDTGKFQQETSSFVFGGPGVSEMSFSSLASSSGTTSFKTDDSKPFHWHGAGQKLFGGGTGGGASGDEEDGEVEQSIDPHFEPIVDLPDLIEVKTGEEDETVEFGQRAKLFRFDTDKNEWKEKGIGEMKILKHKETGKYRLLLRREQVHKLACNHLLTPDLNLQPLATSETSWCWVANDYSDNEPKIEKLAVKFKTIELARSFRAKVDEIQQLLKEGS